MCAIESNAYVELVATAGNIHSNTLHLLSVLRKGWRGLSDALLTSLRVKPHNARQRHCMSPTGVTNDSASPTSGHVCGC
jgi:hypothetical protein